jgi:uncharacterized SAM-binding protein YcdF (DUF218 family)
LLRLVGRLLIAYGLILSVVMYTPLTEWLAQPLYLPASPVEHIDAIVVMEAGATDDGELNESGLKRALRGAELFRAGAAATVVLTGLSPTAARPTSALEPMADLLRHDGVPSPAIVVEGASRNTHESAINVAALARTQRWAQVALVTDAGHIRRAMMAFEQEGLKVSAAPTLFWSLGGAQPALRVARVGILAHEYGGLLYYWWKGWI